ncbi:hypothetical protein [Pedobacter namyangjuensis]|uniref:hypothetical protein n=1 Tax=Pedobacter namyangjuensis TaxID=600626 RepID=UPI000DE21E13|nr:hypothetical protein [Pedobacter namyangjuensis]
MNNFNQTEALPEPWYWTDQNLNDQLASELSPGHILYGKKVRTLARREDNDDVLFNVMNAEFTFAVVHLTWSENTDEGGKWPIVEIYNNWNQLYENRIQIDHENYNIFNEA